MKISVITAVFNNREHIANAIDSVLVQSHPDVELVVIDGGSTDGTLTILEEYRDHLAHMVSEKDRGMYDAANKGISMASGEVIGMLNSDDFYLSRDTLSKVAAAFEDETVDAVYGDLVYVDRNNPNKVVRAWHSGEFNPRKFYRGWMPPHPTFFVRRRVYEQYGLFNLELGTAADYELMLRFLLKHGINAAYIPEVLVKMRSGGMSNESLRNRLRANRMDREAWRVNDLSPRPWTIWLKPARKLGQWVFKT